MERPTTLLAFGQGMRFVLFYCGHLQLPQRIVAVGSDKSRIANRFLRHDSKFLKWSRNA